MRDIRPDLKERLDAITAERENLAKALAGLESEETLLRQMLVREEARWSKVHPPSDVSQAALARAAGEVPHQDALLEALSDGRDWEHAKLKQYVAAKGVDDPQLGRRLQGALMSLRSKGLVVNVGGGVWRRAKSAEGPSGEGHEPLRSALQ